MPVAGIKRRLCSSEALDDLQIARRAVPVCDPEPGAHAREGRATSDMSNSDRAAHEVPSRAPPPSVST